MSLSDKVQELEFELEHLIEENADLYGQLLIAEAQLRDASNEADYWKELVQHFECLVIVTAGDDEAEYCDCMGCNGPDA